MNFEALDLLSLMGDTLPEYVASISRHIERYHAAIRALKIDNNDFVIDASCGYGYGSYILKQRARKVYGLDINNDYLEKAFESFKQNQLYFLSYETYSKTYKYMELADKIVCIETFEHIKKDEIDQFITQLLSFLKVGSDMFITVPLGNDKPSEDNGYHLNEPSMQTLFDLFQSSFKEMNFEIFEKIAFEKVKKECYLTLKNKREYKDTL